jgi:hypothetical protein
MRAPKSYTKWRPMPTVCVLAPFAFDEKGLANRRSDSQSENVTA